MSNTDSSRTFLHDRAPAWGGETEKVQVVCVNTGVFVCARGQQSDKPATDEDKEEEVKEDIKRMCTSSTLSSDAERCQTENFHMCVLK